jgi:hypothetical protein
MRRNKEENGRQWSSPIEKDYGEGSSKSAVPGGGFRQRGRQTVTPHRGAGGGMVLSGRCCTVEGKAKEERDGLAVEAEREKERRSGGRCGLTTWRRGGGGGGVRRPAPTRHRRRRATRVTWEQGREKGRLAGGPAHVVGSSGRWGGRV